MPNGVEVILESEAKMINYENIWKNYRWRRFLQPGR
jgi:hypothetical protein